MVTSSSGQITITDLSDGTSPIVVNLSNEAVVFAGNTTSAYATTASTAITALQGTTVIPVTIGTITGLPTGITSSVSGSNTNTATITFTVDTTLTTKAGNIVIPVTAGGVTTNNIFSYALALQGIAGVPGAPGSPGSTGAPGQIYQQTTEPTTKVVNMLWQYTGSTTITASGATVAPQQIYTWTGSTWILWEITVANLIANKLSSIVSTLGDVTSGSITNEINLGSNNGGNNVLDTGTVVIDNYGITFNFDHLINSIKDSSQQNNFGTNGLIFTKFDTSGEVTNYISIDVNRWITVEDIHGNTSTLTPTGLIGKSTSLYNNDIPVNADLNDYVSDGCYFTASYGNFKTFANVPGAYSGGNWIGQLEVFSHGPYGTQRLMLHQTPGITHQFVRSWAGSTWGIWQEVYDTFSNSNPDNWNTLFTGYGGTLKYKHENINDIWTFWLDNLQSSSATQLSLGTSVALNGKFPNGIMLPVPTWELNGNQCKLQINTNGSILVVGYSINTILRTQVQVKG